MQALDTSGRWVDIAFVENWDAEVEENGAPAFGENIDDMAEYLASQWDYGQETDAAHTGDTPPWGSADDLHMVKFGGITYVLALNRALGYVSLNRRPLA